MMKYQIIGKDDNNLSFVLYSFDELKLATKTFEFVSEMAKSSEITILCNLPPWQSIELQQVETLALVTIEDEP
jgi:hypothetical protein